MATLDDARRLAAAESGLVTMITVSADGTPHASVVNAGVLVHPVTGEQCVGFVARGVNQKVRNLRERPRVVVVFRSGWDWVTAEGWADVIGPGDEVPGIQKAQLPELVREIYAAAVGGQPDEWRQLDQVIETERHHAVLIRVTRLYGGHP
jgi:hypothetical protein